MTSIRLCDELAVMQNTPPHEGVSLEKVDTWLAVISLLGLSLLLTLKERGMSLLVYLAT